MTPRVPLSDCVDHDMKHYSFARTSHLPINYFEKPRVRVSPWSVMLVAASIAVIVAALCGWNPNP